MVETEVKVETLTLHELASCIYDDLGADDAAVQHLAEKIKADEDLMESAINFVALDLLGAAMRRDRDKIKRGGADKLGIIGVNGEVKSYSADQQDAIQIACTRFLSWPMMDRTTKLRNATKEHIMDDGERFRRMAHGHARSAMFLRLVAEPMSAEQTVKDVWSEKHLADLWLTAKNPVL